MKLEDLYNKTLKEVLENDCVIVSQRIHSDDDGNIEAIEIKYRPDNKRGRCIDDRGDRRGFK